MKGRIALILWLTLTGVASAADESDAPRIKEPRLRAELLRRMKADQKVRAAFEGSFDTAKNAGASKLQEEMRRIDTENTRRMAEIVVRYGWPTFTLVGKDGAGCLAAGPARGPLPRISAEVPRPHGEGRTR